MSISEQTHKNDFDMMGMTPKWSRETGTESCLSSVEETEGRASQDDLA